ncbi:MAG: hypothetical protein KDJ90_12585 [Nitratireductor sp.]|nr:hypothetical protein [Nitratireductor sp.]
MSAGEQGKRVFDISGIDPADVARRVLEDIDRARVSTNELVALCLATLVAEQLAEQSPIESNGDQDHGRHDDNA